MYLLNLFKILEILSTINKWLRKIFSSNKPLMPSTKVVFQYMISNKKSDERAKLGENFFMSYFAKIKKQINK